MRRPPSTSLAAAAGGRLRRKATRRKARVLSDADDDDRGVGAERKGPLRPRRESDTSATIASIREVIFVGIFGFCFLRVRFFVE